MEPGRAVRFGYFVNPEAELLPQTMRVAALGDRTGLDLLGIQDHPYQRRFLDTWTLMPAILARTERVAVFPDVANLQLRPPAIMAKAAASLDVISGGRFELGLGAGAFPEVVRAWGGPGRSGGEAIDALEEAIRVIRLVWSGERGVRFDGRFYRLLGAKPGPPPAHPIGIWLGGGGRRTLELVGRLADGWVPSSPWAPPERLPEMNARIDEAAEAAGRSPAQIRRVYNLQGRLAPDGEDAPEAWVDRLTGLAIDHRIDSFVLWLEGDPEEQLPRFIDEVAPVVRERVTAAR